MKKALSIVFPLTLICGALFAQLDFLDVIPEYPEFTPVFEPGAWVEYRTVTPEGKTGFKFSILSKGNCDGVDCYWFEMKTTDENGKWTIMKFKGVNPRDKGSLVSLIVQQQGEQPRRMDMLLSDIPAPPDERNDPEEPEVDIEVEKDVKIGVPMGNFVADKFTITDGEDRMVAWISSDVPLIGLVKAQHSGEEFTELIAFSKKGAKSEMTGKVEKVEVPNLRNLLQQIKPPAEGAEGE